MAAAEHTGAAPKVGDWVRLVHGWYPPASAQPWDSVGLQVGDPDAPAGQVLVALDVTAEVLDEAAAAGAGLVVAHHPLLFRPLRSCRTDDPVGALVTSAIRAGVAVLAAHTNLDAAAGDSPSEVLADLLGLTEREPLVPAGAEAAYKYVVFCPTEATGQVLEAAARAGAGRIGAYSECSWRTAGTGTFLPEAGSHPAVGSVGRRNEVAEDRLEVLVPAGRLAEVRAAVTRAHPYEEVAADVYPLVVDGGLGVGRVGRLPDPLTVGAIADRLAAELPAPGLRMAGSPGRTVGRVAVLGGSGGDEVATAVAAGAELYVTGDLQHHQVLDALAAGMAVIDATHAATEWAALPRLVERMRAAATQAGWAAGVRLAAAAPYPFTSPVPTATESRTS